MLKELTSIKYSINNSHDSLISCINDTIKSKNCPVFSELPVKESKTKESKAVKATDTVNVKTAVTKKTIQEKEETPTYVKTDIIEKAESADAVKKGNEVYSICGREFTGNQSKMMTDAMKKQFEMAILRNNNVNNSDSSEEVAAIARKQGDEVYKIGNQEFTGNQSKMMTDAMKKQFEMAILRNNNANNPDSSKEVAAIARKQGLKLMIFCFTIRNSCR